MLILFYFKNLPKTKKQKIIQYLNPKQKGKKINTKQWQVDNQNYFESY